MDFKIKRSIGAKIKELRSAEGKTQKELALLLNTTQQSVALWEKGETMPDLETFFKLCDSFHIHDILHTFGFGTFTAPSFTCDVLLAVPYFHMLGAYSEQAGIPIEPLLAHFCEQEQLVSLQRILKGNPPSLPDQLFIGKHFGTSYDYIIQYCQKVGIYEDSVIPTDEERNVILALRGIKQQKGEGGYSGKPLKLTKIVPLLGQRFAAGTGEPDGDMFLEDYETDDLRAEFAIHVNGDSMEPYLPDGSIALGVRREPQDGETGAFFLDGAFYVKQFCSDSEGNVYLFSLNRSRSDADVTVFAAADRSLQLVGTILLKKLPLPD